MTDRIIDLSSGPARLNIELGRLVIDRKGEASVTIPLEEIGVVVAGHRQIVYTNAVLAGIAEHNGIFVSCDKDNKPAGMQIPLNGHYVQAERFAQQASATKPTCKRLWQEIVRAKVRAQAIVLCELRGHDNGIEALISKVKSGDPENVEAQAGRKYWRVLFDDDAFRRDPEGGDARNSHLNYGYGVLRAMVARAVCAAGLHPSIGIHHHNRYNAFPLADDLMEPFRPIVDRAVARHTDAHGKDSPLDKDAKGSIVGKLTLRYWVDGEHRFLSDVLQRMASSLAQVFAGESKNLKLPKF